MRLILSAIILTMLVQPAWAYTMADLVWIEGKFYKKFSSEPFTGRIGGKPASQFDMQMEGMMKDGKRDGPWVVYCTNGRLSHKASYVNGLQHGKSFSYYCSGHLMEECTYELGERHGNCLFKNEDGSVSERYTGTFRYGVKIAQ